MSPSAKNSIPFWFTTNSNFEEKSSYPFGSYPKQQIYDLVVLAVYPFGSILSSVSKGDGKYRYSFNGMEKDSELKGEGNSLDFGARIYDSRLGRWLSVDPCHKKYSSYSTYNFALNCPIFIIDFDGRDITPSTGWKGSEYEKIFAKLRTSGNSSFMTIFNMFDNNNKTLNLELKAEKFYKKNIPNRKVAGETPMKNSNTAIIRMNTFVLFSEWYVDTKNTPHQHEGYKPLMFRYVLNDKGKSIALFHEMVHALLHFDSKPNDINSPDEHHDHMADQNKSAYKLMINFIAEENNTNNWGLTEVQIKELSFVGLEKSDGFKAYIRESAGVPEDFMNPEKYTETQIEEYKQKYSDVYQGYYDRITELVYDKEYKKQEEK